jgi:hypothetical protein
LKQSKPARALLLAVALAACSAIPTPDPRVPPPTILDPYPWTDRSPFASGLAPSEEGTLDELPGATVYHADLVLSDDGLLIEGHEEVYYTNREAEALSELYFHLFPDLLGGSTSISGVWLNGQAVEAAPDPALGLLRVPLSPPLASGEPAVIGLDFSVTVPAGEGLGYGLLELSGDVLSLSHILPMAAVYDEEGWAIEPPVPYGDLVFSDAAFFLVRVSAPDAFALAASGAEVERLEEQGRQRVTYAAGPARDFFLAASGRFVVQARNARGVALRVHTFPEFDEAAGRALQIAADALEILEPMLGDYPYNELDMVTTDIDALGMEYPGAFALTLPLFDPEDSTYPPVYLESTLVHELAHQWFFNLVGNDPLSEPWLDEALAQFATLAYFEQAYGPSGAAGFRQALEQRWQRVGGAAIPVGLPTASYTQQEYGAIVYGRGPLFLEALREEMGQAAFDGFLLHYVQSQRWSIATAQDFRSLAEEECACDLGGVFEEWVYAE